MTHEPKTLKRKIERMDIPKGTGTRVELKDCLAYRYVYDSGKVGYQVIWGIQTVKTGETHSYAVNSSISLKQALYFKDEVMRQINHNHGVLPLKRTTPLGTRVVDIKAMIDAGMPDAEYYADDEGEMYGYGLPNARRHAQIRLDTKRSHGCGCHCNHCCS
jgi:hypothetical protein